MRAAPIFFFKKKSVKSRRFLGRTDQHEMPSSFLRPVRSSAPAARLLPSAGSNCRSRLVPLVLSWLTDVMRTKAQFGVSDDFTSSSGLAAGFPAQILQILMPAGICIPRKSSVASLVLFRSGQLLHRWCIYLTRTRIYPLKKTHHHWCSTFSPSHQYEHSSTLIMSATQNVIFFFFADKKETPTWAPIARFPSRAGHSLRE